MTWKLTKGNRGTDVEASSALCTFCGTAHWARKCQRSPGSQGARAAGAQRRQLAGPGPQGRLACGRSAGWERLGGRWIGLLARPGGVLLGGRCRGVLLGSRGGVLLGRRLNVLLGSRRSVLLGRGLSEGLRLTGPGPGWWGDGLPLACPWP